MSPGSVYDKDVGPNDYRSQKWIDGRIMDKEKIEFIIEKLLRKLLIRYFSIKNKHRFRKFIRNKDRWMELNVKDPKKKT